jgi:hypothetical protein
MSHALLWLSRRSSLSVLALTWAVYLVGSLLTFVQLPWPLRGLGAAIASMLIFGYPFLIIFGFPPPHSSARSRRISAVSLMVLVVGCVVSPIAFPATPGAQASWPQALLAVPLVALIFSPFFIATHVLGEARRALGVYKPLDSLGAWICLFWFGFGGVFFLHRSVASAAASIVGPHSGEGGRHANAV